jgi:hypothetical protein
MCHHDGDSFNVFFINPNALDMQWNRSEISPWARKCIGTVVDHIVDDMGSNERMMS